MKAKYKLYKTHEDGTYSKERARLLYSKLTVVRRHLSDHINFIRRLGLPLSTGPATTIIRDFKRNYFQELDKQTGSYYVLSREMKGGDVLRVEFRGDKTSRGEAMRDLRARIKDYRQSRRNRNDQLDKPTGHYLRAYQEKMFRSAKKPTSDALFTGIEIECILPENVDMSPLLPFAKWVNVGTDGSIECDRNEEGREIRVCLKKSEVREVIPGLMKALQDMGARVNKTCGLHVHLDQRKNENVSMTFQKLVRSLGLLYTVVPKSRRDNTYCVKNRHSNFDRACNSGRYKAINATAYHRYQTLEVRLFGGTLEATKIMNWIETLWAIANGEMLNRCPKNFDTARAYWNLSEENVAWLKGRQAQFEALNVHSPITESETEQPDVDDADNGLPSDVEETEPIEICDDELQEVA